MSTPTPPPTGPEAAGPEPAGDVASAQPAGGSGLPPAAGSSGANPGLPPATGSSDVGPALPPPLPGSLPPSSSALPEPATYPLEPIDPPKIGDFWPTARLTATEAGVAYLAHETGGSDVMVVLLSQGASQDPAARDRLAGQVDHMDIDTVIARGGLDQAGGRLKEKFRDEADAPRVEEASTVRPAHAEAAHDQTGAQNGAADGAAIASSPWVALAFDHTDRAVDEARRVLEEVGLDRVPQQGRVAGPDYRLHWSDQSSPGLVRVWPLPWPGRHDRGGRLTILASWLLMILLAAIAILIAILIFSQAPQTSPPPPIPPTATPTDQQSGGGSPPPSGSPSESQSPPPSSGSPSPSSGSPSPSSGSPSPSSGSPSPSSGSPSPSSASPSSSGGGGGSGQPSGSQGSPSPISRL